MEKAVDVALVMRCFFCCCCHSNGSPCKEAALELAGLPRGGEGRSGTAQALQGGNASVRPLDVSLVAHALDTLVKDPDISTLNFFLFLF